MLDSDGDGFANGVELGDPDGDFQNLGPSAQVTNPGNAASKPANRPPVLTTIPPQTVQAGSELTFTVQATDPDVPVQTLTFSLGAGAPEGAALGALTGAFVWAPAADAPAGLVTIPIVVTDSGVPPQSVTGTVEVTVTRPQAPQPAVVDPRFEAGLMSCSVSTVAGATYVLEFREDLGAGSWSSVSQVAGDGTQRSLQDPNPAGPRGFYRIRVE